MREEQLKAIALPLAQVLAYTSVSSNRMFNQETHDLRVQWFKKKIGDLVVALELRPEEASDAQKFIVAFDEFDKINSGSGALLTSDPDYATKKSKMEDLATEMDSMMRADLLR